MKLQLNIRQKISIYVLSTAILILVATISYFSISARNGARKSFTELLSSQSNQYAVHVANTLNSEMSTVRTLSNALGAHYHLPFSHWRELTHTMYEQVLASNPQIDALWDSWEYNHLDTTRDSPDVFTSSIYYWEHGAVSHQQGTTGLDGTPALLRELRAKAEESILEPYTSPRGLTTSLVSPVFSNGVQVGIVGADLALERFQSVTDGLGTRPGSHAFIITNSGLFVSHTDSAIINRTIEEANPELNEALRVADRVRQGEGFSGRYTDGAGNDFIVSISPIAVGETGTPWALGIVVPSSYVQHQTSMSFNVGLVVGFAGIVLLTLVLIMLSSSIVKPIRRVTSLLEDLARGRIENVSTNGIESRDEIGHMNHALNSAIRGLRAKTEFAIGIGSGQLDAELQLLSEHDALGKSLVEMRDGLRKAKEEEDARKEEDQSRSWANEGLAKFGDILRQNNDNMVVLGDEIIKNLVWYLNANIGGIFIIKEDTRPVTLNLVSAFAYDRKRHIKRSFELGEGLVGACAAEKETIFVTRVPHNYIEITSGLGEINPNSLLLIPLRTENDILGVIELASLNVFKAHEIEFVEKLAQSISSTLKTVSINQKTNQLLQRSQEQAEIMTAQEEEMRQNMEELQATQEEAARKASEMESLIDALNASSYVVEYDLSGTIINISDIFLDFLGITRTEAIGSLHSDHLILTPEQKQKYEEFWNSLRRGRVQRETTKLRINGKDFTLMETYAPIKNATGDVYKVLKIATDVTGNR